MKKSTQIRSARKGMMDLNSVMLATAASLILTIGAFTDGFGALDYFKQNADGNRLQVIANAIVSDINRNSDITITCADGTNACITADGGQYDGCSISGASFSQYNTNGDSMATVELSSSGQISNIDTFMYVLCPKTADGKAFSGTVVNPSFLIRARNGAISQQYNFNP